MHFFHFLKVVDKPIEIIKRIHLFEESNNIKLPPIFRTFLQTYETLQIGGSELLSYFSSRYNCNLQFYLADFVPNNHINIEDFYHLENEKILAIMEQIYEDTDIIWKEDLLGFASCNDQGILMVGIGKHNSDQIFIEYAHATPRISAVSENIFRFFQEYEISINLDDLPEEAELFDLYKNWGEDFWRVREKKAPNKES